MKKFFFLFLAFVFCITLLLPMPAHAQGSLYGQIFAINQPIIVDWSSYASVGKKFRVTLTDLKTKSKQVLKDADKKTDKVSGSWAAYYIAKKASYSVTIEVLDEYGNTTRTIRDYFHVGDFVVGPPEEPTEKLIFTGLPMSNSTFSTTMWSTWNVVSSNNPAFLTNNCDSTPKIWVNEFINSKYAIDGLSVILLKSRVSGFQCNLPLEADLFKRASLLRAAGGKKPLQWSNNLGRINRLRAISLCDEPLMDPINSAELGGKFANTLSRYNMHPGDMVEWIGYYPGTGLKAANLIKTLENDNKFMTALLSDHKYGAIAAVQTSMLMGKRQKGLAVLAVFSN